MLSRIGILVLLGIAALLVTGLAYAQNEFVFDFDDWKSERFTPGVPLNDWEAIDDVSLGDAGPSTWEIRDSQSGFDGKALFQGSNIWGNAGDNVLMGTFLIYKGEKFTDFIIDVDVVASDNDGMGLVWAYEDTGKHYRVIMINDGWPSPPFDGVSGPFIKLSKRIGDEEPFYDMLEAEEGVRYAEGSPLHWTLEVMEGSFKLEREDGKGIEGQDAEYTEGYVGLQLYAQQAEFDNFTITSTAAVDAAGKMATVWGKIKN